MLIGYVITDNNIATSKGFFAPFPGLIVRIHERFKPAMSHSWDHWSLSEELAFRRLP
jgi:hypothetical protein